MGILLFQSTFSARAALSVIAVGFTIAGVSTAHADKAADVAAGKNAVAQTLGQYNAAAGAANGLNQAYAGYQWGPAMSESKPGNGNWLQVAISNGDAEKLLKIAETRCGPESAASVQQIQLMLQQYVSPQAAASYASSRNVMCQAVQVAAQLVYRYNQYQSVKANGITLKSFEKTEKFSFPNNRERHASFRGVFKWYPDVQDTATNGFSAEDRLSWTSDFKWSDDAWRNINVVKKLRESMGGDERMICIPFADFARGCFNIVDVSTSSVTIDTYVKFHVLSRDKTISLGPLKLPAPFGYLDQLAQMKDKAKQDLMNNVMAQLSGMLNLDQQTVAQLQKLVARANAPS